MQVAHADFFGSESPHIFTGMALNSTAQLDFSGSEPKALGNPTEGALLLWMLSVGVDYRKLREECHVKEELPFSTERKFMATVARTPQGKTILYVKGAPEIVMNLCTTMPKGADQEQVNILLQKYQSQAMRTLGFAYKELDENTSAISNGKLQLNNLDFLGIVGISDPVRNDVPDAVREVLDAGIDVKIVTGDTPGTAKEIGRQVGVWQDDRDNERNITTGPEIAAMTDDKLEKVASDLKIIARARPMDKKRLVEALQRRNHVVAVTVTAQMTPGS